MSSIDPGDVLKIHDLDWVGVWPKRKQILYVWREHVFYPLPTKAREKCSTIPYRPRGKFRCHVWLSSLGNLIWIIFSTSTRHSSPLLPNPGSSRWEWEVHLKWYHGASGMCFLIFKRTGMDRFYTPRFSCRWFTIDSLNEQTYDSNQIIRWVDRDSI